MQNRSNRLNRLKLWGAGALGVEAETCGIRPASEDASFRLYYRLTFPGGHCIAVYSPPEREDNRAFLDVAKRLRDGGLNVPEVIATDLERGFLLLSDLGERTYLDALATEDPEPLYEDALAALARMQRRADASGLPDYDRPLLLGEMELFERWLLREHLQLRLQKADAALLRRSFSLLADAALAQPRVFVHRDYHSRNLMRMADSNPGILDFQDAVYGPYSYDLVSLLKDCYICWPPARVRRWACSYLRRAQGLGLYARIGEEEWLRDFEWMGMQRHLKAAGIFARLWLRDGKRDYLPHLPRTLAYIVAAQGAQAPLPELRAWLRERALPRLERAPQ